MGNTIYEIKYADHAISYSFKYTATRYLFRPLPQKTDKTSADVSVTAELLDLGRKMLPSDSSDAYVEYRCLIELTANALLKYDCCIFHSVSFIWKGYAWLLAAPSGTGKTTQYFNWERLYPGEITMISGDMPVLERRDDGSIWAHPSTWNGKEKIGNRIQAPIAGIVLLRQGKENHISRLSAAEAIPHFFEQFMVRPDSAVEIHALERLMDQMVRNVPVWELVNKGNDQSTELLRDTLNGWLNEFNGDK